MLRFFENDTATLGQMLGQRILKCKLSSAVITLIAPVQVVTIAGCLIVQWTFQCHLVVLTDVL